MGAKSARLHNHSVAMRVTNGIQRILGRVNRKYTPLWMLKELEDAQRESQCVVAEIERVMRGWGDEI